MTKQFWGFLVVGLVAVAIAVSTIWTSTKGNHLTVDGKIMNVRSIPLEEGNSLVAVDFRVTNPSDVPLVIREVSLKLDLNGKEPVTGIEVSKGDVDYMFQAHPLFGSKDNDVLAPPETIPPGKTLYRMAEASFKINQASLGARKNIAVHIEDVDGAGFDISEKPQSDKQ